MGSRDLQKGDIFAKKGRSLTEDTPVTPIKGMLRILYIPIFNTHFP